MLTAGLWQWRKYMPPGLSFFFFLPLGRDNGNWFNILGLKKLYGVDVALYVELANQIKVVPFGVKLHNCHDLTLFLKVVTLSS